MEPMNAADAQAYLDELAGIKGRQTVTYHIGYNLPAEVGADPHLRVIREFARRLSDEGFVQLVQERCNDQIAYKAIGRRDAAGMRRLMAPQLASHSELAAA